MLRRAIVALVNELGNHILVECERTEDAVTIRIAGPTSVSENTLTPMEASEVHRQLGYVLTTPPVEATARPAAIGYGQEHIEPIAQAFHETYERLAPEHGYKTREASAVPWAEVPANNRGLMIAVVASLVAEGRIIPGGQRVIRAEALRDLAEDEDVAWLTQACADKPKGGAGTDKPKSIVNIQSNCPPPAQVIVMNDPRMRA